MFNNNFNQDCSCQFKGCQCQCNQPQYQTLDPIVAEKKLCINEQFTPVAQPIICPVECRTINRPVVYPIYYPQYEHTICNQSY